MKKGNHFPRATARWVNKQVPTGAQNAPTWVRVSNLYVVYIYNDDGVPTPQVLSASACQPARWAYHPPSGAIVWRGTWDDLLFHGHWQLTQRYNWRLDGIAEYRMEFVGPASVDPITYESAPANSNMIWSFVADQQALLTTRLDHNTRWAFWSYAFYHPMTYQEIYAMGEDPDDTRPLTWRYAP